MMRMLRITKNLASLALLLYICILVAGFVLPEEPKPVGKDLSVYAIGDTLWVKGYWKVTQGSPDSVIWQVSSPKTALVRRAYLPSATKDSVRLIPTPALLEGDSLIIAGCWQTKKKQVLSLANCLAVTYIRPVDPGTVVPDSLRVVGFKIMIDPLIASSSGGVYGWTQQVNTDGSLCPSFKFADNGKIALRTGEANDTTCARIYATSVGQLNRMQSVTYVNGHWVVGALSPARQAALDNKCIIWNVTGGTIIPGQHDVNCNPSLVSS